MPIVVDPKKEIEDYLQSQGYLPFDPQNSPEDTYDAIIEGAARFVNKWTGVDFNAEGYCWDHEVTKTDNALFAAGEAAARLNNDLSCYYSEDSILSEIVRKLQTLA